MAKVTWHPEEAPAMTWCVELLHNWTIRLNEQGCALEMQSNTVHEPPHTDIPQQQQQSPECPELWQSHQTNMQLNCKNKACATAACTLDSVAAWVGTLVNEALHVGQLHSKSNFYSTSSITFLCKHLIQFWQKYDNKDCLITRIVWQHFPTRNKTLRHLALDSNRREHQPPCIKIQNSRSRSNKKYNVINGHLDTSKNKNKQSTSKITSTGKSIHIFSHMHCPKVKVKLLSCLQWIRGPGWLVFYSQPGVNRNVLQ